MTIDYSIHLSDVAMFVGGVIAFAKIFVTDRDLKRELVRKVNQNTDDIAVIGELQDEHQDYLTAKGFVRSNYGRRRGDDHVVIP